MSDISLDLSNQASTTYKDLLIVESDLVLTADADPSGTNPILQNLLQRLSFIQGEWFMDNTLGIPYFQQILVKRPDQSKIETIIQRTILTTPGVTQLLSFSASANTVNRILTVSFSCLTTSGPVSYSGAIGG